MRQFTQHGSTTCLVIAAMAAWHGASFNLLLHVCFILWCAEQHILKRILIKVFLVQSLALRACDDLTACLLCQVDRPSVTEQQCNEVQSNLFDLFAHLGATDDQLDFTTLYASAREVSAKAGPL